MGFIELALIGIGLAMDAFAVSICKGLASPSRDMRTALILAASFGFFQGLMPVIGYFLGASFSTFIEPVDHWIAFVLLVLIGAKMVYDAIRGDDEGEGCDSRTSVKEIIMLSIATSIDALAIGISFALLSVDIVQAALTIGIITFALSFIGFWIGHAFGARFEKGALIFGGIVLILIGLKILFEHLGFLSL